MPWRPIHSEDSQGQLKSGKGGKGGTVPARWELATAKTVYEAIGQYGEHHATQKGILSQDHQLKHQNRDEGGQATKAGCGYRVKQSGQKQQAEQARQAIEFRCARGDMPDTTIKKVEAGSSPRGEMGQKYLVAGKRVSMRLWSEAQVANSRLNRKGL
jgi:hypothetical protein